MWNKLFGMKFISHMNICWLRSRICNWPLARLHTCIIDVQVWQVMWLLFLVYYSLCVRLPLFKMCCFFWQVKFLITTVGLRNVHRTVSHLCHEIQWKISFMLQNFKIQIHIQQHFDSVTYRFDVGSHICVHRIRGGALRKREVSIFRR